ncbi:phosphomannomutase [Candidatus Nitrososphaera evergladensis SR1]|uniref:Phosphomannomutase n=1 Tax=Candidatus Nitrososphaera evergladensis SR1 TaxID=1459636 RepID=A0A075MWF1_9ARCH|nr:phosphomannomutase [Candidatus Nitrososphaera evergladensis]AIF84982.1 phosphomannomutase [Candidatus Nitrososphaera evergladensis SR1]
MKVSISGARGIYGSDDLTLQQAALFAGRFASLVKSRKCIVARDTRPSGPILSQVVSASLMAAGIDVYNLGVASTPAAFREARKYGAGIIITASHNPLEWNGLKFIIEGRGLFEKELEQMMLASNPSVSQNTGREYPATASYVDDVAALVDDAGTTGAQVAVGIDAGGGASCGYSEKLFKRLGIKFQSINSIPGVSSRGPDPTADDLADLRALVTANKLALGFALDLDGDRLVVVNEKGEKLNPDATLLLCVARAAELGAKKFVTSIDTSVAVAKYVRERGGTVEHSKVGEANVVNKMLETGAEAGGEGSSAGFIMPKFNMCRDGLLAAATIATLDRKAMDDCLSFASQFVQVRSKIAADSSLHARVIEKLPDALKAECSQLITGDGVKGIIDEDSWVLVRSSNTEHAIRVSVESRAQKAQALYKKMSEKVQRIYHDQAAR